MQRTSQAKAAKPGGGGAIYALLAVPILGMGSFFWIVSHRITKPDISIFDAIQTGNERAVRDHLLTGTPPDLVGVDGHSALYTAVVGRRRSITRLLLDHGAKAENEGRGEATPVFAAAMQGNEDLVKELLDKGAKDDVVSRSGDTLLHAAATAGNAKIIDMLLARGARVNAVNHAGATALCDAATANSLESVELLLRHGAKVNVEGDLKRAPLHLAAQKGNYEIVKRLISAGADADARDRNGVLPLAIALGSRDNDRLINLLIDKTTKFWVLDFSRATLLHYAVKGQASPEVMRKLLAKGVDPDRMDYQGDTPLTLAMRVRDQERADLLIKAGARVPLRHLILSALHNTQPTRNGFKGGE